MNAPRRVVVDEDNLRTALRQQLKHSEQQNLVIGQMNTSLGRAGRLTTAINKLVKNVESGNIDKIEFHKSVSELMDKFNTLSARGSKAGTGRGKKG